MYTLTEQPISLSVAVATIKFNINIHIIAQTEDLLTMKWYDHNAHSTLLTVIVMAFVTLVLVGHYIIDRGASTA